MNQVLSSICPHLHLNGLFLIYSFLANKPLYWNQERLLLNQSKLKVLLDHLWHNSEELNGQASIYFIPEINCHFPASRQELVFRCKLVLHLHFTHLTFEFLFNSSLFLRLCKNNKFTASAVGENTKSGSRLTRCCAIFLC